MKPMRKSLFIALVSLTCGGVAAAAPAAKTSISTTTVVSTDTTHGGVCSETADTPCSSVPPAWQQQLEQAQSSWGACEADVNRLCEGVQVGEGRIEKCLKDHRNKVSKACRKAQGLK